eukprot:scaffold323080_cov53-Cyclotella_meneghiniana.AAC.1
MNDHEMKRMSFGDAIDDCVTGELSYSNYSPWIRLPTSKLNSDRTDSGVISSSVTAALHRHDIMSDGDMLFLLLPYFPLGFEQYAAIYAI